MSNATSRIIERLAIIGTIDPDAYGTGDQNSDVLDMKYWRRIKVTVLAGTLGSSATLDVKAYGDIASNGSFATQITGKQVTQLTEAGTDSDKQAQFEITQEEMLQVSGWRYVRITASLAAAASDYAVLIEGEPAHYSSDVTGQDLSTVDELVG